jgi:hypothetical protein
MTVPGFFLTPFLLITVQGFLLRAPVTSKMTGGRRDFLTDQSSLPQNKKHDTWRTLQSSRDPWERDVERDIEQKSRRKVQQKGGGGVGETAAGAVLGGLLLGPFGTWCVGRAVVSVPVSCRRNALLTSGRLLYT